METIKWMQDVAVFLKVAEVFSFSTAAKKLGVSKSYVSKAISRLESELGASLFSRSTRKMHLTHIGEEFRQKAKTSIESLEAAKKNVLSHSSAPQGHLRITVAGVFGEKFIAPVAIAMAQKYPDLKVDLDFSSQIVNLIEEGFDVAIRFGELKDSSLKAQKMGSRREFFCASPEYLQNHPKLETPSDLSQHRCLGTPSSWIFVRNGKNNRLPLASNFRSNNPHVLLKAALAGLGIVRLPGSYVAEDIKKGNLVVILEKYTEQKKDIWAVSPPQSAKNVNVRMFIAEVKKMLQSQDNESKNLSF
jgi:DNA-binding transcriptional LysR family regulator